MSAAQILPRLGKLSGRYEHGDGLETTNGVGHIRVVLTRFLRLRLHTLSRQGQAIQQRSCSAHSPGM
jgi:hypothetical protein